MPNYLPGEVYRVRELAALVVPLEDPNGHFEHGSLRPLADGRCFLAVELQDVYEHHQCALHKLHRQLLMGQLQVQRHELEHLWDVGAEELVRAVAILKGVDDAGRGVHHNLPQVLGVLGFVVHDVDRALVTHD